MALQSTSVSGTEDTKTVPRIRIRQEVTTNLNPDIFKKTKSNHSLICTLSQPKYLTKKMESKDRNWHTIM